MITFKCNRSGNTVSFDKEADILSMRKEAGYTEVKEIENGEIQRKDADETNGQTLPNDAKAKVLIPEFVKEKKRGRPKNK